MFNLMKTKPHMNVKYSTNSGFLKWPKHQPHQFKTSSSSIDLVFSTKTDIVVSINTVVYPSLHSNHHH